MKRLTIVLIMLLSAAGLSAREVRDMNRDWKFYTYNEKDSTTVNLPHTWNRDAAAGRRDYYRGTGNYLKYVDIKPEWRGQRLFVKFYGANCVTDLLVNGRHAGGHKGGNNAFVFEITNHVEYGRRNLLWVVVNNSPRTDVLPTADAENSYGGIFRGVELIVAPQAAVGLDGFASDGVFVTAAKVSAARAEGTVRVAVNSQSQRQVRVDVSMISSDGTVAASHSVRHRADKGLSEVALPFSVDTPLLWDGVGAPNLYLVKAVLTDGNIKDSVEVVTGFRYFSADHAGGFSLNGRPYPLRGVVLYRDRAVYGPVSSAANLSRDLDIIREMGANAIRVAGGTHSPEFYRMCDERGIIVLADSPFTGSASLDSKGFYDTPEFRTNGRQQLQELIYQRYNNPSVAAWGIFSEAELRGDDPVPYIRELNALAKSIDPGRFTYGCSNRDGEVNSITDLIVWNHTLGWGEGQPEDIGIWQAQLRADPVWSKALSAVSYHCGGSPNQRSDSRVKPQIYSNWHPEQWQAHVHKVYLDNLNDNGALWGVFVGNMFDYGSARYVYGELPGVNDYGLVTYDRGVRKEAYWLYKANWNTDDKFIRVAEILRSAGEASADGSEVGEKLTVTAYSNHGELELFVGDVSRGAMPGKNGVFVWRGVDAGVGNVSVRPAMPRIVEESPDVAPGGESEPEA